MRDWIKRVQKLLEPWTWGRLCLSLKISWRGNYRITEKQGRDLCPKLIFNLSWCHRGTCLRHHLDFLSAYLDVLCWAFVLFTGFVRTNKAGVHFPLRIH